jgi:hypothetical protein
MAGCATPSGSAGHAGETANLKLTFHLDHSAGADQPSPKYSTVSPVAIRIPVFQSLFACDDDYQRVLCGRYDPSLVLSAKARVNIDVPIVDTTNLKSPHRYCPQPGATALRVGSLS